MLQQRDRERIAEAFAATYQGQCAYVTDMQRWFHPGDARPRTDPPFHAMAEAAQSLGLRLGYRVDMNRVAALLRANPGMAMASYDYPPAYDYVRRMRRHSVPGYSKAGLPPLLPIDRKRP